MEFLYSALCLNQLRVFYILLRKAQLDTFSTPERSIQPGYTHYRRHGWSMYNSFLCVLPDSHFYGWVNRNTFRVQIFPKDSRHRRLSVCPDSNSRSRGWDPSALTTRPTVLPKVSTEWWKQIFRKLWTNFKANTCCQYCVETFVWF